MLRDIINAENLAERRNDSATEVCRHLNEITSPDLTLEVRDSAGDEADAARCRVKRWVEVILDALWNYSAEQVGAALYGRADIALELHVQNSNAWPLVPAASPDPAATQQWRVPRRRSESCSVVPRTAVLGKARITLV